MKIYEKLCDVQTHLKAPKNLRNTFGNYNYRNAEGILEALKPYLVGCAATVLLTDDIVEVGGRIYVKATATFIDNESGESVSVSAMAREAEQKKGMDESQITGCASSYARKYALNGLFLLDDTKDADTDEYHKQTENKPVEQKKPVTAEEQKVTPEMMSALLKELERTGNDLGKLLDYYKLENLEDMSCASWKTSMATLKKKATK